MNAKTYMTCGFAFMGLGNPGFEEVLLIQKNRPKWQAGKLNGIGGKAEASDGYIQDCMSREFFEEAGLLIPSENWTWFMSCEYGRLNMVDYFAIELSPADFMLAHSKTDEKIVRVPVGFVHLYDILPNLHWIIPLARYTLLRDSMDSKIPREYHVEVGLS